MKRIAIPWAAYQFGVVVCFLSAWGVAVAGFGASWPWWMPVLAALLWANVDLAIWARGRLAQRLGKRDRVVSMGARGRFVPVNRFEYALGDNRRRGVIIQDDNAVMFVRGDAVLTRGDVAKFVKVWLQRQGRGLSVGRRYWLDDQRMRRCDYDLVIDVLVRRGFMVGRGSHSGRLIASYSAIMVALDGQGRER